MVSLKTSLLAILPALLTVAGEYHSPTSGQELKIGEKFKLNWSTKRYFKESPQNITVLLSSGNFVSNAGGYRLIHELPYAEYTGQEATFEAELSASLAYGGKPGPYQLVVLENYQGYGSEGFAFFTQDVTLVQ